MFNLEIGQRFQFFEPTHAGERVIPQGTIVKIGAMVDHFLGEADITMVVLGRDVEILTVPRHVITMHCWPL
jgi:hypothetical protein